MMQFGYAPLYFNFPCNVLWAVFIRVFDWIIARFYIHLVLMLDHIMAFEASVMSSVCLHINFGSDTALGAVLADQPTGLSINM